MARIDQDTVQKMAAMNIQVEENKEQVGCNYLRYEVFQFFPNFPKLNYGYGLSL